MVFGKRRSTLERGFVTSQLARLFEEFKDVKLAIVFGSLAREGVSNHDVDVAVKFAKKEGLLDLGYLASKIAETLNVSENAVDVLDLDHAPPPLLFKVLREGVVVKGDVQALKEQAERIRFYPDILIELRGWSTLDPNPKPDRTILSARVEEIRRNVSFLKDNILSRSVEELGYGEVLMLEGAMHRMIEAMLDVCRHLVSVYSLGLVESYGEYARKLAADGKMPEKLAEAITKLAGLRNILVHRYIEVDISQLYSVAKEVVDKIAVEFIEWVKTISV